MRRLTFYILLFSLSSMSRAQVMEDQALKKNQLRMLATKLNKQRDPSIIVSSLQSLIGSAKATNKYGKAIYYELLLGEQYEKINDYASAESIFVEAYEDAKKHLPAKHKKYYLYKAQYQKTFFDPIDRLAYFYLTIGNLKHAEQLFRESKSLRNNFFSKHSIHRVHPIVGLGSYYFRKGQYEKTYAEFSVAQAMMAKATTTGYDFDNLNRLFLNDLVELCLILHKEKEALQYINKLSVASSGFGKFSSSISANMEVVKVFELKSRYYIALGDYSKTQEYLDKANHYNPTNFSTSKVKLKLLKTEAVLHWYQHQLEPAAQSFQKMINAYHEHIQNNFAAMSDYEREQFYYTLKSDFDLFNSFVLENPVLASSELCADMYDNVIRSKALLLNSTNRLKNQILKSGNQSLINNLHQWEKAKDELAALYFEKESFSEIDSLEKNIEVLERKINQASGLFQQKEFNASWRGVQATLKEGEAAIEIVRVNTFNKSTPSLSAVRNGLTDSVVYIALMVTPTSERPECFHLKGNKLESRYLTYYRNSILSRTNDTLSYNIFWRPIKNNLKGIKRIFLSADGAYNEINLNTLMNPANNNYLIDEIDLVLVTNTGDLLTVPVPPKNNEAMLIGHPAYAFSDTKISYSLPAPVLLPKGSRSLASEELINLKDQEFSDLPGTAEEISRIATELRKQNMAVTTLLGADASEETVKALKNPDVLHIATHGFFVNDTASSVSPMIRSGIILAGVRNAKDKGKDDGILTAYEATNLDLEGTDLVVLSACETGLGEVRNGEGVYGLQRSIIVAGAKNLLMSLWKVDDEATVKLMSAFYQQRSMKSTLAAFREAQIQLRTIYPEPFYWGAFVMLGK